MKLRPYQESAVQRIIQELTHQRSTLVVMATGTGKTVVMTGICRLASKRVLILAHRGELVQQAVSTIERSTDKSVGIEMADQRAGDAQIVCASVQSLVRRLDRFDPSEFGLIVTDESHHATAGTYQKFCRH